MRKLTDLERMYYFLKGAEMKLPDWEKGWHVHLESGKFVDDEGSEVSIFGENEWELYDKSESVVDDDEDDEFEEIDVPEDEEENEQSGECKRRKVGCKNCDGDCKGKEDKCKCDCHNEDTVIQEDIKCVLDEFISDMETPECQKTKKCQCSDAEEQYQQYIKELTEKLQSFMSSKVCKAKEAARQMPRNARRCPVTGAQPVRRVIIAVRPATQQRSTQRPYTAHFGNAVPEDFVRSLMKELFDGFPTF